MQVPKLILVVILCAISGHVFAQSDSAIKRKMTDEVCVELSKKKNSFTQENFDTQIGLALMPFIVKYGAEIEKLWGYDYTNEVESEEIGKKLGQMLILDCPTFNEIILKYAVDNEESNKSISGTLLKITNQQFTYLLVKNKNGKEEKIWWLEYFTGSEKLQPGQPSLINKIVSLQYKEIEFYDAVNKDYKTYKVATALK